MVAHWQVEPVGVESICWISEHAADVEGVIFAGVKVCVISNHSWHAHLNIVDVKETFLLQVFRKDVTSLSEHFLNGLTSLNACSLAESHKFIESFFAEHMVGEVSENWTIKKTQVLNFGEIDHGVSNSSATSNLLLNWVEEGTKRNVFQWEVAVLVVRDPTFKCLAGLNHANSR